jgi:hypothetical protein
MNILTIEVLNIFRSSFQKAIDECNSEKKTMKIISETGNPRGMGISSTYIKVQSTNPEYFYYLGMKYQKFRSEI